MPCNGPRILSWRRKTRNWAVLAAFRPTTGQDPVADFFLSMNKHVRPGNPERQSYWEGVLRRWSEGGQSVRDYCLAEGLRESAFYFWRRKLAGLSPPSDAVGQPRPEASTLALAAPSPERLSPPRRDMASFLPVQVVEDAATEATRGVEILLAHGRTVRVQAGFDRKTLAEVLAVLEVRPC